MRKKTCSKNPQLVLTFTFSIIIFNIMLITMLFVSVVTFILIKSGIIDSSRHSAANGIIFTLIINAVVSTCIGTIFGLFFSRIPLKPVEKVIAAMNRLSSGDYRTRLQLGSTQLAKDISESFNTLAEELESTEMLRSDFINNFSHEFKTPIVSIAGFAKLLKKGSLTEEQQREYLNIIEEESLRLSDMATNVLNLTKVENQTILTDTAPYNLSEQIRVCVLLLERKWTKKELDFSLEFNEHTINAGEELLKQVWINLIDNAVKFSPQGSTINIVITETENNITVSVANTGSCILPEDTERIFNKFYQADKSHSTEGNGVGLAIVKRAAELHGGKVTAESRNGRTIFTVDLPKNTF